MVQAVPDILSRIAGHKREELKQVDSSRRAGIERRAADRPAPDHRDFRGALAPRRPAIIAEIKQASPSKGTLTTGFDPASAARVYYSGGAAALSVLTDREFFQGSLNDLEAARAAAPLPVLRKDFTLDEYHVLEAAAHGADAILLIAALLNEHELRGFRELAESLRMAALVEVHDSEEIDAALASGASIIGVNNRDLRTFEVRLETSLDLAARIPDSVVKISESGIQSSQDVRRLMEAGFDACLVGERLMKSADPARALAALLS